MFVYEKMNEDNVSGMALLEKENFTDGWSLESLKEEINNPDALYMCVRDDENGRIIREERGDNCNFWIKRITEYLYHGFR